MFPLTFTVPATAAWFVVFSSLKLAVVSVEFFIGSEKVADTGAASGLPFALIAGETDDTVGGVVSAIAAVVKLQEKAVANAFPAASFAAVVMVPVYWVLAARLDEGVNLAVFPLTLTVPLTATLPDVFTSLKLEVESEAFVIASEKVADIDELMATADALLAGDVEDTVGGVTSGAAAVVKCQE